MEDFKDKIVQIITNDGKALVVCTYFFLFNLHSFASIALMIMFVRGSFVVLTQIRTVLSKNALNVFFHLPKKCLLLNLEILLFVAIACLQFFAILVISVLSSACVGEIDPDLEKTIDLSKLRVAPLKPIIQAIY